MKLGQTSVVHFSSQIVGTVVGFLVTIYLARILGSAILGQYFLVLALVAWLQIPSTIGIRSALSKRLSEGSDTGEYVTAGALAIGILTALTILIVLAARSYVNQYVGLSVTSFVVVLLVSGAAFSFTKAVLTGQRRVHVVGLLTPLQTISRGVLQVALVVLGFQLVGLLLGQLLGLVIATAGGVIAASVVVSSPTVDKFKSLFSFAKYSWLSQLRARAFNRMDLIVLGLFVQSSLIGIYSISWNIAAFLGIFASSMSTTLFPELSRLTVEDKSEDVSELIQVSMSYAGVIHIPGLVGAFLLGNRILRIYGDEFVRGTGVLTILVFAYLIYSFTQQIITALNGIDRPDLAFRANAGLVAANVVLNLVLVYRFGWIGAAVATTLAVAIGFGIAYWNLSRLLDFTLPLYMIGQQSLSALVMGGFVFTGLRVENTYGLISNNAITVTSLVFLGAGIYFGVLVAISSPFRSTVFDNLPLL